jgi:hypothetical protein
MGDPDLWAALILLTLKSSILFLFIKFIKSSLNNIKFKFFPFFCVTGV